MKMNRVSKATLLCIVTAVAAGCGGGGGSGAVGGGGSSLDPRVQAPRTIPTDYDAAAAASSLVDAINYDVNVGPVGNGVTVAFMGDNVDRSHPTLRANLNVPATMGSLAGDTTDESISHGTLAALLIGGVNRKDVYGIAYESDIEFICCSTYYDPTDRIDFDRFEEGFEYLAEESEAFVVSHSYHSSELELHGFLIYSNNNFDFSVIPDTVRERLEQERELEMFYKACVDPDLPEEPEERLCVYSSGDHGFHRTGKILSALGELNVEDLLDPMNSYFNAAERQEFEDDLLYKRGGLLSFPRVDERFEGHFLVVAALENEDSLADYTNGCGEAMDYCLSAPGIIPFEICPVAFSSPLGICATGSTPDLTARTFPSEWRSPTFAGLGVERSTYFAAPLVAGAVAVLKSTYPSLDAPAVATLLLTTAVDLGVQGIDREFGHGRLDLGAALRAAGVQRTSAGVRLEDTRIKAGSSTDAALATSTASFGMFDMHDRPFLHFVSSRMSSTHLDPALSLENWQHSSAALMEMNLDARMGLSGSQRGAPLLDKIGLAVFSGWEMGLERCHLSCPTRRDVQVGSLVESSALAWTQSHIQVPGGRMGLVLETGLEEGGMTYTNRGLFAEARPEFGLLRIEAGMLDEKATFMGSTFTGALDVRPGDSQYISASLGVPVGDNAFSASYTLGKASSGLVENSYVTEIDDVSYDAYRLAFGGERWELGYTVPLAATKGGMRVESIGGYTGSEGDWSIVETDGGVVVVGEASAEDWSYRTDSHWIDLGAGARERRLGLTMARPYGNWDMTFAVEHVANSPRRFFAGDEARAAVVLSLGL